MLRHTDKRGVDVILDHLGGAYLAQNVRSLAIGGRLALIGVMGGRKAELDSAACSRNRLSILGSVLRPRPVAEKAAIIRAFERDVMPHFAAGRIAPLIHRVYPLEQAAEAHRAMESSEHFGKLVLRVRKCVSAMTILRSLLFVPGNKSNMLEKALGLRPDAFVPDMEDSVPAAEKANARATIASFLPRLAASGIPVIPRVNALDTDWIEDDLAAVVGPADRRRLGRQGAQRRRHQRDLAARSATLERRAGSSARHRAAHAVDRDRRSHRQRQRDLRAPASASSPSRSAARTSRTTWASSASRTNRRSRTRARAFCVAARAAHVLALDTPYFKLRDPDGLRDNSLRAKSIGFKGRFAIHPEQIGGAQRVLLAVGARDRARRARRRGVRGSRSSRPRARRRSTAGSSTCPS